MNDATEVTNWIVQYRTIELSNNKEQQEHKKKELLTKILEALRPMILARCSYYFGYTTEDLIQLGYARMIELLDEYDSSRTEVPVIGYLNRMIACYYFSLNRKMRKEQERMVSFEQETLESVLVAEDVSKYDYDWQKILSILNEKEYTIVKEHILNKKNSTHYVKECVSRILMQKNSNLLQSKNYDINYNLWLAYDDCLEKKKLDFVA